MSKLNEPPPDPVRSLKKSGGKIIRNRKRRPLHPDTIRDMIYERSKEPGPTHPGKGWLLIFWDKDGRKHYTNVVYVKDPDGQRRQAQYEDVKRIRDYEMEMFEYEKCWLIMA